MGAVDPEGDALIYSLAETPQYGTVQIAADGTYTYIPGADFAGIDEFTVAVTDPGFNLLQPYASRQSLVAVGVPNACGAQQSDVTQGGRPQGSVKLLHFLH